MVAQSPPPGAGPPGAGPPGDGPPMASGVGPPPMQFTPEQARQRAADDMRPLLYSLTIVFTTLSFISVCLRLYTRKALLRIVGADDIAIAIAMLLSLGVTATTIVQLCIGGLGRHTEFASLDAFAVAAKSVYANTLIYNAAQFATKISFLVLYRRLFPGPTINRICIYFMGFLVLWFVGQEFMTAFSCDALLLVNPKYSGGCVNNFFVLNANAIVNIVTDFAIFAIPCQPVLKLRLSNRRKAQLLMVFSLGLLACVVSILRLHEIYSMKTTIDPIWDSGKTSYWSIVELNVGILCACLPTLRPLIMKLAPGLLGPPTQIEPKLYSHKMSTMRSKGSSRNTDDEMGIYLQKEVEFQSTTNLRSEGGKKPSVSMDKDSLEDMRGHHTHVNGQLTR